MAGMDITARNEYPCDVATAFAMLNDPAFLERVAEASAPLRYEVRVSDGHTWTQRTMASGPPVEKFTGPEVSIVDQIVWDEPGDGECAGEAWVELAGLPLSLHGHVRLFAEGARSVLEYTGELKVGIPVLGKKLEGVAAPLLLRGLDYQQAVADEWLGAG
jgi:hypothetical protein